jgi:hypothetical protein
MTKSSPDKKVRNQEKEDSEDEVEAEPKEKNEAAIPEKTKKVTLAKKPTELPYKKVPELKPVVEVPPIPAKHLKEAPQQKPSYQRKAEIEDTVDYEDILERILNTTVGITQRELMAVAPKLRAATKELISQKRVRSSNVLMGPMEESNIDSDNGTEEVSKEVGTEYQLIDARTLDAAKKQKQLARDEQGRTTQTWVVDDPITQYLSTLSPTEVPLQMFTCTETGEYGADVIEHLKVIPVIVNGVQQEEAILDSGSQMVTMHREVAEACKLVWDPKGAIHMQSANGQLTKTCGVARDVPFTLGDITIYLQVHVLEGIPYRVLLGRPFDVLTSSQVDNNHEGDQSIKLTDPNSGKTIELPTYDRKEFPRKEKVNFQ